MDTGGTRHGTGRGWLGRIACMILGIIAGVVPGARAQGSGDAATKMSPVLRVVVTIPPLRGLVTPLVPGGTEVRSLVAAGRSEHGYEFTPGDLAALTGADLVVLVGLGMEPRVEKELKDHPREGRLVLNLGEALGLHQAESGAEGAAGHHEGHDHEPASGWIDQHVWLDPVLVQSLIPKFKASIASAMERRGFDRAALVKLDEAGAAWEKRVAELDAAFKAKLGPLAGRVFVTHHNAFSRLAARYGLRIAASIRQLEDTEPTPGEIAAAVGEIKRGSVRAVFVEPQRNQAVPRRIAAAAKVRLGVLDPLGNGDWIGMMEANLAALVEGLGDEKAAPTPALQPSKDEKR